MGIEEIDNYFILKQSGPFGVVKEPTKKLIKTHADLTRTLAWKYQTQQLLNLPSLGQDEIVKLAMDPKRMLANSQRAYERLAAAYGIQGKEEDIVAKINGFGKIADDVVYSMRTGPLKAFERYLEPVNEVKGEDNPFMLGLMAALSKNTYDGTFCEQIRFEAARKLLFMRIYGAIDKRKRDTRAAEQFPRFLNILNQAVLSTKDASGVRHGIGWSINSYVLSEHRETDMSCLFAKVIDEETARKIELRDNQKITLLKRRILDADGSSEPLYLTPREKIAVREMIKTLRKNEDNPEAAIDDSMGVMVVLDNQKSIWNFLDHFIGSADKAKSFIMIEEIEDRMKRDSCKPTNIASHPDARFLKCFARMAGMRIELMIHTNETYMEYLYMNGVSHDEYDVRRFFIGNVPNSQFPQIIYRVDWDDVYPGIIKNIRQERRQTKGDYVPGRKFEF